MEYINRSVYSGVAGKLRSMKGFVFHNDAGSMTAKQYLNWLPSHSPEIGFAHYYCDRFTTVRAEDTYNASWHTGTGEGNYNYIGGEVCESMSASDEDFIKNEDALLMQFAKDYKYYNMTPSFSNFKLHREFTPTACPHRTWALHGGTLESVKGYLIGRLLKMYKGEKTKEPEKPQPHIIQGGKRTDKGVDYRVHIPNQGWLGYVNNSTLAGTVGKNIGLEAIEIFVDGTDEVVSESHISNVGWKKTRNIIGSTGKGNKLEAFKAKLTGKSAKKWMIEYQSHIATKGWEKDWHKENEVSGTTGKGLSIEAVRFRLVQRPVKQGTDKPNKKGLEIRSHISHQGWLGYVNSGETSGTTGLAVPMEAFELLYNGSNKDIDLIGHSSQIGWMPAGKLAGTTGRGLALEAFKIKLKGKLSEKYTVEYRAHVSGIGWQDWKKENKIAGTTGEARSIEAIQIKLTKK